MIGTGRARANVSEHQAFSINGTQSERCLPAEPKRVSHDSPTLLRRSTPIDPPSAVAVFGEVVEASPEEPVERDDVEGHDRHAGQDPVEVTDLRGFGDVCAEPCGARVDTHL